MSLPTFTVFQEERVPGLLGFEDRCATSVTHDLATAQQLESPLAGDAKLQIHLQLLGMWGAGEEAGTSPVLGSQVPERLH